MSGVHLTSVTADGKRYQADWVWQKIAVDLIRRETGWRIWHMHIYDIFRCPFGQDWVTFSAQRPALDELWAVERCFTPYGKPPGHGCQYHWEYSLDSQPSPWPTPPLPYANADGLGGAEASPYITGKDVYLMSDLFFTKTPPLSDPHSGFNGFHPGPQC